MSIINPHHSGIIAMSMHSPIPYAGPMAVAATWSFGSMAAIPSIHALMQQRSSIDAVEMGIRVLELDTKDQYYVGIGGLPNADGEMELDAAMMDHTARYGAVMGLQKIKNPISVARSVLEQCVHNVLVGEGALQWAVDHGFEASDEVLTEDAKREWMTWKNERRDNDDKSHDTIGLICLDSAGRLAAGTSTSG
jgi:N4-(beta-N-acetylglucosaminyl)-L-asparaginase